MGIFSSFFKKENSKEEAKNRLKLVLIQDRAMLPSGVLDNMKDDILKVLSKYVEIEKSKLNIEVCPYDDDPRKIALVANIPILKSSSREVTKTTKQNKSINSLNYYNKCIRELFESSDKINCT